MVMYYSEAVKVGFKAACGVVIFRLLKSMIFVI